ncbi:MAG: PepSY-like domain-containing protein [Muribaculaceae bacterium]|nr:PepSY-like domain-containing protein [Muribaculaceae bacterium]
MMKKYVLLMVAVICCFMSGYAFDKYSIDRNDLPEAAQSFLKEFFPKAKVGLVKTDKHLLKKTDYDVKLVNGTKIEFNNSGKWTSVDCKTREVPEGIIPKPIRTYVKKNFPDVKIVKIEKTSTKYEVELSDDVELTFNLLGQFKSMKIDD